MIRLNCHLSDELGERLNNYCDKMGMSKVAVVTMALSDYLNTAEAKQKIIEQMSDPNKMAEIMKAFGISADMLQQK